MKKLFRYLIAIVGLAVLHSFVLYAFAILSFVGSFGAPQGGDAPATAQQLAQRATVQPYLDAFQRFLDFVLSILSWPGRLVPPLSTGSPAWIATSLFWACVSLCTILFIVRLTSHRANHTRVA